MATKKKRSQYFLTEPNWAEFSLAQTDEEKAAAWKKAQYFIHAEIPSKECYKTFRNWVNKFSKWDKKMKKKVLEAPDYAFLSICLLYTSPSPRDQRGSGLAAWA